MRESGVLPTRTAFGTFCTNAHQLKPDEVVSDFVGRQRPETGFCEGADDDKINGASILNPPCEFEGGGIDENCEIRQQWLILPGKIV